MDVTKLLDKIMDAYKEEFSHYSNEQWENIFQQCMRYVDGSMEQGAEFKYNSVTSKKEVIADHFAKIKIPKHSLLDTLEVLGLIPVSEEHLRHMHQCYCYSLQIAVHEAYPTELNNPVFINKDPDTI